MNPYPCIKYDYINSFKKVCKMLGIKSFFHHTLIYFIFQTMLISFLNASDGAAEFLNNLRLTHWDDWGINTTCPNNLFVTGLKVRTVEHEGSTSVNAIQIICSDEIKTKATRSAILGRPSGEWKLVKKCKSGFAVGFSAVLSSTAVSSPSSSIQSFQIYCSNDSPSSDNYKRNGRTVDAKEQTHYCDSGDAITGLSVRADSIITVKQGDTASVKQIMIECKSVSNPANYYDIEYVWEKRPGVMKCNESDILQKLSHLPPQQRGSSGSGVNKSSEETIFIKCNYESWSGIGVNSRLLGADASIKAYSSMGLNNNKDFVKWAVLNNIIYKKLQDFLLIHYGGLVD